MASQEEAMACELPRGDPSVTRSLLFPQWFRSAVVKEDAMPAGLMTLLFSNIDPIYEFHRGFLCEVEQRLALW